MALLSDFFIATLDEARSFDADHSPISTFPTIPARAVDQVKIVMLQCILDGSTFEDHLSILDELTIREVSEDGPWVIAVPTDILMALSEADDDKLVEYGAAWASTQEWVLDAGRSAHVIDLTRDIAGLAREAISENKGVYVWVSL